MKRRDWYRIIELAGWALWACMIGAFGYWLAKVLGG